MLAYPIEIEINKRDTIRGISNPDPTRDPEHQCRIRSTVPFTLNEKQLQVDNNHDNEEECMSWLLKTCQLSELIVEVAQAEQRQVRGEGRLTSRGEYPRPEDGISEGLVLSAGVI